jgi:hypothetical protein
VQARTVSAMASEYSADHTHTATTEDAEEVTRLDQIRRRTHFIYTTYIQSELAVGWQLNYVL